MGPHGRRYSRNRKDYVRKRLWGGHGDRPRRRSWCCNGLRACREVDLGRCGYVSGCAGPHGRIAELVCDGNSRGAWDGVRVRRNLAERGRREASGSDGGGGGEVGKGLCDGGHGRRGGGGWKSVSGSRDVRICWGRCGLTLESYHRGGKGGGDGVDGAGFRRGGGGGDETKG